MLFAYVIVSAIVGRSGGALGPQLIQNFCLWLAVSLLSWQTLRKGLEFARVAVGVEARRDGVPRLAGVAILLVGVAFLLIAVAAPLGGANLPG